MNDADEVRAPQEWSAELGVHVLDPDGWRFDRPGLPAQSWDTPLTRDEFIRRVSASTTRSAPADWPPP